MSAKLIVRPSIRVYLENFPFHSKDQNRLQLERIVHVEMIKIDFGLIREKKLFMQLENAVHRIRCRGRFGFKNSETINYTEIILEPFQLCIDTF